MRKLLALALTGCMMLSLVACGDSGAYEIDPATDSSMDALLTGAVEPEEVIPNNFMEERVGEDTFDSFDEIIGNLRDDEAYAIVDMGDEEMLLISEYTWDNLDGNMASMEAYAYLPDQNGKYTCAGPLYSDGTGDPLAMTDDGLIYCVTHHTVDVYCVGDNGTDCPCLMILKSIYEEFEGEGDDVTATYGGFIRTERTVVDNDGETVAADDSTALEQAFEEYTNVCHVIDFTVISENNDNMANPWIDTDEDGFIQNVYMNLLVPEGATDVTYRYMPVDTDMGALGEMDFTLDGVEYTARLQSLGEFTDISGMYYDWTDETEAKVDYNEATIYKAMDGDNEVQVIMWYDIVPGLMYTVSAVAPEGTADMEAVANMVYTPAQGEAP